MLCPIIHGSLFAHKVLLHHSSLFSFFLKQKCWTQSNLNSLQVVMLMPELQSGKHIRADCFRCCLYVCLKMLVLSSLWKWNFQGKHPDAASHRKCAFWDCYRSHKPMQWKVEEQGSYCIWMDINSSEKEFLQMKFVIINLTGYERKEYSDLWGWLT